MGLALRGLSFLGDVYGSCFVIFLCIRISIIYEEWARPKVGNPKFRAMIIVNSLWIFAVTLRIVINSGGMFA